MGIKRIVKSKQFRGLRDVYAKHFFSSLYDSKVQALFIIFYSICAVLLFEPSSYCPGTLSPLCYVFWSTVSYFPLFSIAKHHISFNSYIMLFILLVSYFFQSVSIELKFMYSEIHRSSCYFGSAEVLNFNEVPFIETFED